MQLKTEYDLVELNTILANINSTLPKGMVLIGYQASKWCDRCDQVLGSYDMHFEKAILWGDRRRNYLWLCPVCLDSVIEAETTYQEELAYYGF